MVRQIVAFTKPLLQPALHSADTQRVMSRGAPGIVRYSGIRVAARGARRALLGLVTATITALTLMAPTPAEAGTQFWLSGKGWGHGIGLSQYGAQGFAKHGFTYDQIIRWYYQGVTLGPAPTSAQSIDVMLGEGRADTQLHIDAAGATITVAGAATNLSAGDDLDISYASGKMTVTRNATKLGSATVDQIQLDGPDGSIKTQFTADNGTTGRHYRGSLLFTVQHAAISVVNHVELDKYVRGVVPGEMPPGWLPAALQAQAVAARSYAIATAGTGYYDVHCDTRSQMYVGMEGEAATTDAAVAATSRTVAFSGATVITAFFSSTSGGRTAAVEDVWGGSPRPYLASVADPYEQSPYEAWPEQTTFTPAELAARLGVGGSVLGLTSAINQSARVSTLGVATTAGTTTLSGTSVQYRLGLRSTYFRFLTVSLNAAASKVRVRHRVQIAGTAPRGATLWARSAGRPWALVAAVTPTTAGAWSRVVRVRTTTIYQLRVGARTGPAARVIAT